VAGSAPPQPPPPTNPDPILLITLPTLYQTKSTNSSRPSASRTDSKMKRELRWLRHREKPHPDMITTHALLQMLMPVSEEPLLPWNWWNCSLRQELQEYTLMTRDLETRNAVTWEAKSLFLHENMWTESWLWDFRQILWTLKPLLLLELMHLELNLLTQILTQLISHTSWESAQMVNWELMLRLDRNK
jgi:hypothetical protein